MDKIIIFKTPDGVKSVYPKFHPLAGQEFYDVLPGGVMVSVLEDTFVKEMKALGRTDDELLEMLKDSVKHHMTKYEYRIASKDKLADPNRDFRGAWTDDFASDTVDVDMVKARPIHMDRLRQLRQKKFESLGFANKINDELEALLSDETKGKLKALRDIPQTYDLSSANTPDELKSMVPDILK